MYRKPVKSWAFHVIHFIITANWPIKVGYLQYNRLGQPLSQTGSNGVSRRWHYDPRGNLLRLENGNGGEYRFTYDPTGRPLSEVRPDDTSRQMEWNERGLLTTLLETGRPDDDGGIPRRAQKFSYDSSGLLTSRTTRDARYHYQRDNSGQLTGLTRTPTAAGMALGIEADDVQFTFDAAGKLLSEQGVNGELHSAYDVLGNLTALTLPGGQQISWLHYGSGHVSAIRFNQQTVSEFTRDRLHREVSRTQGTREQTRQYDRLGRRTLQRSLSGTEPDLPEQMILERTFHYTGRGELSDVSDTLCGSVIYGYDEEGCLLRHYEARPDHSTRTFRYDAADNLLPDDGLPALPLTDNRLTLWQNLFMKYDWWGNLVSRRSGLYEQHYEYDAENRLIRAEGNGPEGRFTAHYHYDALGRRTRKTVTTQRGTTETHFLWQGFRLLQEQQQNGQYQTYIYDPKEAYNPLARVDHLCDDSRGEILWFSTDLNGAPLEITDESGELRWSGHYGSFGDVARQTEGFHKIAQQTALHHQPLRYAGQYADSETGLHYNLFRYYDPHVGRFTVLDPIGLAGGWNFYQYAPNPLGWIDPWGLSFGSGKGTHTANATLFDSDGNVKAQGIWQSGNMTPEEKALGFLQSSLATHIEARITRELDQIALPGDKLVIDGQYPPCTSCRGKMNTFKLNTGSDVVYTWPDENGERNVWSAAGKKSTRARSCSG